MRSVDHTPRLTPSAQQLLFALMELGHLDDAALDLLSGELSALPPGPVDEAALRRLVAGVLFERPPAEPEQAKLLATEWSLLFG